MGISSFFSNSQNGQVIMEYISIDTICDIVNYLQAHEYYSSSNFIKTRTIVIKNIFGYSEIAVK